jgi:hypothetical protein
LETQQERTAEGSTKKSLEYLFLGIDPVQPSEFIRTIEEGFRAPEEYKLMGMSHYPGLVNSVASADLSRISHFFKTEEGLAEIRSSKKVNKLANMLEDVEALSQGYVRAPSGQLLVCKVLLSNCQPDKENSYFNSNLSPSEIWNQRPVDLKLCPHA